MQIDNTMETTQHYDAEFRNETYKERSHLAGEQDIGEVMTRITHVDDSVYVKSMHTEEVWNDVSTFSSGNKFIKEFKIRQEMTEEGYVTMI
eukprot:318867-Ditylum_brightwellii.AAC.1